MLTEIKIGSELKCLRCGNKVLVEEIKLVFSEYRHDYIETIICHHCGNEYNIKNYLSYGEEWEE